LQAYRFQSGIVAGCATAKVDHGIIKEENDYNQEVQQQ
jgi:hypothetical protein